MGYSGRVRRALVARARPRGRETGGTPCLPGRACVGHVEGARCIPAERDGERREGLPHREHRRYPWARGRLGCLIFPIYFYILL